MVRLHYLNGLFQPKWLYNYDFNLWQDWMKYVREISINYLWFPINVTMTTDRCYRCICIPFQNCMWIHTDQKTVWMSMNVYSRTHHCTYGGIFISPFAVWNCFVSIDAHLSLIPWCAAVKNLVFRRILNRYNYQKSLQFSSQSSLKN